MRIPALILAALVAVPAVAQTAPQSNSPDAPRTPLPYDRGYDKPSARTDAINAAERPALNAANNAVLEATTARDAAQLDQQSSDVARYDADMVAYRAALRAHDRAVAADEVFAARQERAYADAMRAWRIQVADCDAGVRAACRAPSPRPADYW